MRLILFAALAALALSVGCGGSDESVPAKPTPSAKDNAFKNEPNPADEHCDKQEKPVQVRFSRRRYPQIAQHIVQARGDFPAQLHIDRKGAQANRHESVAGWDKWKALSVKERKRFDPKHWQKPHGLSVLPPAIARESGKGANVKYVLAVENRNAVNLIGNRLARFCDGQAFQLVVAH